MAADFTDTDLGSLLSFSNGRSSHECMRFIPVEEVLSAATAMLEANA